MYLKIVTWSWDAWQRSVSCSWFVSAMRAALRRGGIVGSPLGMHQHSLLPPLTNLQDRENIRYTFFKKNDFMHVIRGSMEQYTVDEAGTGFFMTRGGHSFWLSISKHGRIRPRKPAYMRVVCCLALRIRNVYPGSWFFSIQDLTATKTWGK
jgi:hypothetical protein